MRIQSSACLSVSIVPGEKILSNLAQAYTHRLLSYRVCFTTPLRYFTSLFFLINNFFHSAIFFFFLMKKEWKGAYPNVTRTNCFCETFQAKENEQIKKRLKNQPGMIWPNILLRFILELGS